MQACTDHRFMLAGDTLYFSCPHMKELSKKRFSVGRRVLKGLGAQPATVTSVADVPSVLGEYMHEIILDAYPDLPQKAMGCELRAIPKLDADLHGTNHPKIHIQDRNIADLNLSSEPATFHPSPRPPKYSWLS